MEAIGAEITGGSVFTLTVFQFPVLIDEEFFDDEATAIGAEMTGVSCFTLTAFKFPVLIDEDVFEDEATS